MTDIEGRPSAGARSRLADPAAGRDNNFNLIRIVAALAVLVSHSFALTAGSSDAEPGQTSLGMTAGSVAVDAFFVTSGFLVTASLTQRRSVLDFVIARALRIFPALLLAVLLTVFGIGVFFTSLPLQSYLLAYKTHFYLVKCATLIFGVAYQLPGVFADNPYRHSVNGSLWTLPVEVRMYALLVAAWVLSHAMRRRHYSWFSIAVVGTAMGAWLLAVALRVGAGSSSEDARLLFMFFCGAAFHVLRGKIIFSRRIFWSLALSLLGAALAHRHLFFIVYTLGIAYLLFYLAYIPGGRIRSYNRLGDYSYGAYIYAFPIQQSVAALMPGVSLHSMIALSGVVTALCAAASWHVIEQRALESRSMLVGRLRQRFASKAGSTPDRR